MELRVASTPLLECIFGQTVLCGRHYGQNLFCQVIFGVMTLGTQITINFAVHRCQQALRTCDAVIRSMILIMITDWNFPSAVPSLGSAIFMHQWRRPGAPTAGCIAMDRQNLIGLAEFVVPGTKLIIR